MAQVNGDTHSSAFFSHLLSYPVISDSISTFKSHPVGQKTLKLSSDGFDTFGKPMIPYLQKPYSTISPYVVPYALKADSIGDSTLTTIDTKFPYVKKPTGEIYEQGKVVVFFPLQKGLEGKEYVFKTFNTEKKNVGADGVVGYGKAVLATGLIVSSDALSWLGGFLSKKQTEVKEVASEKLNN